MFYVGIVDVLCLCCNGFSTGLFAILGYVYCSSPKLIHTLGCIALGLWVAQCDSAMIIALNRCLEMYNQNLASSLFDGKKVYLWLLIPTFHGLFIIFFTTPIVFSGLAVSWFFNPHLGYYDDYGIRYANWYHVVNNFTLVTVLTALYTTFVIFYARKAKGVQTSSTQKQTFLQVLIICIFNIIAASIYIYEQFFPVTDFYILVGSYTWVCAHGFPAVIYLTMNRSIRKHLTNAFGFKTQIHSTGVHHIGNASTMSKH
uniref:Uncharacterized protein n=1 Tax=Panagrolaimus sp. PS1159 TaxID=55785 RepID=A0AC35G8J5_9BILA